MLIMVKLKRDIVPNRNNPSFSNKPSVLLSSYRCASLPSSGNKSFSKSELHLCDERRQLKKFFRQGRSRRINSMYSETFFKGDLIIKIFIVYIIRLNHNTPNRWKWKHGFSARKLYNHLFIEDLLHTWECRISRQTRVVIWAWSSSFWTSREDSHVWHLRPLILVSFVKRSRHRNTRPRR